MNNSVEKADERAARIKEEFTPRRVETHQGWLTDAITTMPHSTWDNGEVCVLFVERRVGCTSETQGQTQYIFGYWVCSNKGRWNRTNYHAPIPEQDLVPLLVKAIQEGTIQAKGVFAPLFQAFLDK